MKSEEYTRACKEGEPSLYETIMTNKTEKKTPFAPEPDCYDLPNWRTLPWLTGEFTDEQIEKRGLPMSLWSTWQIVAQAMCFFFGMSITNAFGWQGIWVAGGITVAASFLVFGLLVRLPRSPADQQEGGSEETQASLMDGLNNKNVWLVCIGMLFFTFANFGFVTWVASAWSRLFALDLETANRYISLMFIWALPISFALGFVLDRVDHKRFCVLSFFLYAFAAAAAFLLPGKGWIIPYIILYPFLESAVCASMWTLVPETVKSGRHVSVAMALFGQLTREFAQTRARLSEELEKEIRDNDLVVELNAQANKLYGDIMAHEGIIAYNKAKVEIDGLIAHIDAIITAALEGRDPMTVEKPQPQSGSCSGNCSSCASSCSQ